MTVISNCQFRVHTWRRRRSGSDVLSGVGIKPRAVKQTWGNIGNNKDCKCKHGLSCNVIFPLFLFQVLKSQIRLHLTYEMNSGSLDKYKKWGLLTQTPISINPFIQCHQWRWTSSRGWWKGIFAHNEAAAAASPLDRMRSQEQDRSELRRGAGKVLVLFKRVTNYFALKECENACPPLPLLFNSRLCQK